MRNKLVLEFWDRSNVLSLKNKTYRSFVEELIGQQMKEDDARNDITTKSLMNKNNITAQIISNQEGIVAGIEEASLFTKEEKLYSVKKDCNKVKKGDIIIEIKGNASRILGYERTLLNIMQRMSGIATEAYNTKKLVRCQIAATRKTLLHLIDKKAVSVGKGLTHRLNLSDFILIKDNHLKILNNNIKKALELANKNKIKYVEIEVKNEKEALEAAKTISNLKTQKIFAILFDNMKSLEIKNSIKKINSILDNYNKKNKNSIINKKLKNNNKKIILFEASGDIRKENIKEYGKAGIDIVSLGFLTHSPKAFDMSMEIK